MQTSLKKLKSLLTQMDELEWLIGDMVGTSDNMSELTRDVQHDKIRINTMARLAKDFPNDIRDYTLPFSIHAELYGYNNREKTKWLRRCKTENLNVIQLRKLLREDGKSAVSRMTTKKININPTAKEEYEKTKTKGG